MFLSFLSPAVVRPRRDDLDFDTIFIGNDDNGHLVPAEISTYRVPCRLEAVLFNLVDKTSLEPSFYGCDFELIIGNFLN